MGIAKGEQFEVNFLEDIKRSLAAKLTVKGQASTGIETLTALVNKVTNIEVGKKVASGQTTMTWNGSNFVATVTGLNFVPKTIVATSYQNGQNIAVYDTTLFVPKTGATPFNMWTQGTGSGNGSPSFFNISSSGFSCRMWSFFNNGSETEPFYWIAIG